jgi:hypothetical protein
MMFFTFRSVFSYSSPGTNNNFMARFSKSLILGRVQHNFKKYLIFQGHINLNEHDLVKLQDVEHHKYPGLFVRVR